MLEQNPAARLIDSWYFSAIAEHAEALMRGQLRRLVVTQPPGTYKSRTWAIAMVAWAWLHWPEKKFLVGTNDEALGMEHSTHTRRLIRSQWYRSLSPTFDLAGDQDAKKFFQNTAGGHRQVTSVGATVSGKKADDIILDDPHDATQVHRPVQRAADKEWFRNSLWDRQKNFTASTIVVVGHQLNRDDLPNDLIRNGWPHLHLVERMEDRLRKVFPLGHVDPRRDGEYLRPTRFGPTQEAEVKRESGELVWLAKHQGDPRSAAGSDFPADKLPAYLSAVPADTRAWRYWDTAATVSETSHPTSGALIGKTPAGRYVVIDVHRGKWTPAARNAEIVRTAQEDRYRTNVTMLGVGIEQEPGGSGVEAVQAVIRELAGFNARADRPTGDKRTRAQPLSSQWCAGNVDIVDAPWTRQYVERMESAHTRADCDDRDASSGAFAMLTRTPEPLQIVTGPPRATQHQAGTFGANARIDPRTAEF